MNGATYIFWIIFVIPLIAFLVWLMRQDKRKGKVGLIVLAVLVVGVIAYLNTKAFAFSDKTLSPLSSFKLPIFERYPELQIV
jgi:glucan phosphoethanolaminetransferase (alkaline phosphatase superfamily)